MIAEPAVDPAEFVPLPVAGRRVSVERTVHLGDVVASGRLRLDALANYLQDVASDDVEDAGLVGAWVLRRLVLAFGEFPRLRDTVTVTTFCSGYGSRWAERRTIASVDGRVAAEAVALWVYVDEQGRPTRLRDWFFDHYQEAAGGRQVTSRLRLREQPAADSVAQPWPLRVTDVDVLGHVNNAASWAAVEDELARRCPGAVPARAEIEFRAPVDLDDPLMVRSRLRADTLSCWLTCGDEVRTAAVVRLR